MVDKPTENGPVTNLSLSQKPKALAPTPKPSPGLTKEQIIKSLNTKPVGPVRGLPVIGAGGLKPFRPPPDGTISKRFVKFGPKPLRHSGMEK